MKPLLIMGLSGAGKTTLAKVLAPRLGAVHFNNDDVRANVGKDLDFSIASRIEQARRMRWLCDTVLRAGTPAIADFICPTEATRQAFGDCFVVWVNRTQASRYPDTDKLFEPPNSCDVEVTADGSPEMWAERIARKFMPAFDPRKPTALFVGRYQPFHDGHKALIEEGLARVGQVCIAVRDVQGVGTGNPLSFDDVKQRIDTAMAAHRGRYLVIPLPNVSHIFYGRDVGYAIERIDLDDKLQAISATSIRAKSGLGQP